MNQDYPQDKFKVYVLDDGRRGEIKTLTEKLGCNYITRPNNEDVKAGNLNNGLKYSNGELVLVFDCDHVPVRCFLKDTVGFFSDPKVAFVQTPHHFYNPDTFQRNLRLEREICNEQDLFFHVIQPGRDHYNSAFFAGSGGIFRRSCLEEIGGFKTETLTEDLHTSMELHSRGYKSCYVNKDLAAGLSPESYASYLKQRKRWARGGVQIFILDNPILKKGLTLHQRLNYFASVVYFFHGLPRLIYLTAPLSYLLFGYPPLMADIWTLLNLFVSHYIGSTIAFNRVSKGHRNPFWSDVYETVMSFGLTNSAFMTFFKPKERTFSVTPKMEHFDKTKINNSFVAPHILLLLLLLFGGGLGIYNILTASGLRDAILISLVWAAYNSLILVSAIIAGRERVQRRGLIRLARKIKTRLILPDKDIPCVTRDISETGLSIILSEPIKFPNPTLDLMLISDYGETTKLRGRIMRNDIDKAGRLFVGTQFIGLDEAGYQGIIRQMYSPSNSWSSDHNIPSQTWDSFRLLFIVPLKAFIKERVLRRISPRFGVTLPCEVRLPKVTLRCKTIDISPTGLSLEISSGNPLPKEVDIIIYLGETNGTHLRGNVMWQNETKKISRAGIRFLDLDEGDALWNELKGLRQPYIKPEMR
jgi:cellulose synthase (UDP-forming)